MTTDHHDLEPHRRTYGQFMRLTAYSAVAITVVLMLMALFLLP